jgi:glycosyltransferase involved in cell wall biosynthesis
MSDEKGVFNFVKAIPEIVSKQSKLTFILGGSGALYESINIFLNSNKLDDKVKLVGWIAHSDVPDYLNKLKLLVLPSYTEGLPNIVLEAMACGTPVLATPVGAISDIIRDGETGFIMENNSPACIAENVVRALECPDLEKIVLNARELIEKDYKYEVTVEKFKSILNSS